MKILDIPLDIFFDISKSFSEKENDEEKWYIEGYATTKNADFVGDFVTEEAIKNSEKDLLKNSTVLRNHNLDDEIQTMMLNLIRGDVTRIQRIKPVQDFSQHFVQRVKPFCEVLEKEIALYAYFKNITFQTFPCPYAGTALRNDVRNMLNQLETKHPGTKFSINRAFEKIRSSIKVFSPSFEIRKCLKCGDVTVNEICRPCHILNDLDLK